MFFDKLFGKKGRIEAGANMPAEENMVSMSEEELERAHDRDFRACLKALEKELHSSESTEEITMGSLRAACEFYDAEFAGLLIADVNTEAWSMAANYNRLTGQNISRYTKETESFDGFSRWIEAYGNNTPIVIPDVSLVKKLLPKEYALYERLDVQSLIGAPFGEKPTGFFIIKNPKRYKTIPDMAQMLAFVGMSTFYLQELQQDMELLEDVPEEEDDGAVHINILGVPEVRVGNKQLDTRKYNSAKAWAVLGFLALKNKEVPSRSIVTTLWPDTDPDHEIENFRSTLYQLRRKFKALCPEIVGRGDRGYGLNKAYTIIVDAHEFDDLWEKASREKNLPQKVEYLKKAVKLYRGHLFNDQCSEAWLMAYYHHYSKIYSEVIMELLDELGKYEHYSIIHEYASQSLHIQPGNLRTCFWLVVSTYFISGPTVAVTTMNSFNDELSMEEVKSVISTVNSYLTEHGKPVIDVDYGS